MTHSALAIAGGPARRRSVCALLLMAGAVGCASSGTPSAGNASTGPRRDTTNLITEEQLRAVPVTVAYDAVSRLRPQWLQISPARSRTFVIPVEIVVLVDEQYYGDANSLRSLPVSGIREIRYMGGSEAANAFPLQTSGRVVESAILVYFDRPVR